MKTTDSHIIDVLNSIRTEWLSREGVTGIAIGRKIINGNTTEELAIVLFVKHKKQRSELPAEAIFPATISGVRTDVVEAGLFDINDGAPDQSTNKDYDFTRYRPCPGGVQIQVGGGFGTAGAIVRSVRTGDDTSDYYLLSNHHVTNGRGAIYQPTTGAVNCLSDGQTRSLYNDYCDASIAKVYPGQKGDIAPGFIQGIGPISKPYNVGPSDIGKPVAKRGRSTRTTHGILQYVNFNVHDQTGKAHLDRLVIKPNQPTEFCSNGDSGSVLVADWDDNRNAIIGLLTAKMDYEGEMKGFACTIKHVIEQLEIEFIIPSK